MERIDRFFKAMNRLVENICAVLMVILTLETCYVVVMRRIFNNTPSWGEIVARMLLVYACLIGYSIGVREDSHIRIDCFDRFIPRKVLFVLDCFTTVCLLIFSIFAIVGGINFTILCSKNIISGLGIPSSWMMICVPIGGVFCLIQVIGRLIQTVGRLRRKP